MTGLRRIPAAGARASLCVDLDAAARFPWLDLDAPQRPLRLDLDSDAIAALSDSSFLVSALHSGAL